MVFAFRFIVVWGVSPTTCGGSATRFTGRNPRLLRRSRHRFHFHRQPYCLGRSLYLPGAVSVFTKTLDGAPTMLAAFLFVWHPLLGDDTNDFLQTVALAKYAQGDLDGALADFNKAIELHPNHAFPYIGRGSVKQFKGDFAGALDDYIVKPLPSSRTLLRPHYNRGVE